MDILIPISLGFFLNIIIYILVSTFKKNKKTAIIATIFATVLIIILSFLIGRWIGMGLGVISIGMLLAIPLLFLLFGRSEK